MIRSIVIATIAVTPAMAQDLDAPVADTPTTMSTQSAGGPAIGFTLRGGVSSTPEYFGSGSNEASADLGFDLNYFQFGRLRFGDPDPLFEPEGFGIGGSLRFIGERDDSDSPELDGLDDVDASLELGVSLSYAQPSYRVFGAVRYGVVGHEAFVGEVGMDAFVRPTDRLTLRLGPRALFGEEKYVEEYFGVDDGESAASDFDAFDPDGGLVSTGVEVGAGYRFSDDWGLDAAVRYDRLRSDASDSPISEDDESISARIGVTRRFTFGF